MKHSFLLFFLVVGVVSGNQICGVQIPTEPLEARPDDEEERLLTVEEILSNSQLLAKLDEEGLTIDDFKALPESRQRELSGCGYTQFPSAAPSINKPSVSMAPSMSPSVSLKPSISNAPTTSKSGSSSCDSDDDDDDHRTVRNFLGGAIKYLYRHAGN